MEEIQVRKATTKTAILSLVDREYLKSTANISRRSNEAISFLYAESDGAIQRTRDAKKDIPAWVHDAIIQKRLNLIRWLDEILLTSQSVDALRSWQMMTGLSAQQPNQRPSGAVMPEFHQPTAPGQERPRKRGIMRNGAR